MERYKNLNRNSGVIGYEIESDSITVWFSDGGTYLYTYQRTGIQNIEQMKTLAIAGRGLNSFISRVVKKRYAKKIR